MRTRKELKQRAKDALKRNYWKIVLVTFLAVILGGGSSAAASAGGGSTVDESRNKTIVGEVTDDTEISISVNVPEKSSTVGADIVGAVTETANKMEQKMSDTQIAVFWTSIVVVGVIIALLAMALVYAFIMLLYNPFYTGVCRFMLKSVDDKAEVKEVAYGFDHSYKNVVKTMFHADLRIFLWTFLLIIPGIYKKYQYRMVAYILAEHPDMNYREALRLSSDIMSGEKWHAFVLDVSFIPWRLLGMITCGIVGLFYANPYIYLTNAALYRRLCERRGDDEI